MAAVAPAPEDRVAADAAKLVAAYVEDDEQRGGCCCGAAPSSLARRATSWCRRKLVSRPVVHGGPTEPAAKRVLVAVAAGTEPLEAAAAADILNRAGASVTVATVGTTSEGLVVEAGHGVNFAADARVAGLEAEEFDLIVLPGGMAGSANLRDCKQLEKMVRKHAEKGRLCGAIGASPAVALARWGVLEGFKATCHPALLGRLGDDDGVLAVDDRVVTDRNVVTSQGVGTAIEFALEVSNWWSSSTANARRRRSPGLCMRAPSKESSIASKSITRSNGNAPAHLGFLCRWPTARRRWRLST